MTQINAYLTFNGNCREAMTFYSACLGGELILQTIGESPLSDKMPAQMKDSILHSALTNGPLLIMGTDCVPGPGLIKGNSVSLALNCGSEPQIRDHYAKLSAGGEATHPLEETFWGALFGALTDKFGNHWVLNYTRDQKQ
jgi:PhnB protein